MKHTLKITLFLMLLFLTTQFIGLIIINEYIDIVTTAATGKTTLKEETYATANFIPPDIKNESISFMYVLVAILIGTGALLLIIKLKKRQLWKAWFFISVLLCLLLGLTPFVYKGLKVIFSIVLSQAIALQTIQTTAYYVTIIIAGTLAFYKVFKRNVIIHNFTEVFIYGGLASMLVPIINLFSATLLLILVSVYDAYAVWKSKHMVTMAKFQSEEKTFAGLFVPYSKSSSAKVIAKTDKPDDQRGKVALLGGGDMAFPLIFSGVVLKTTTSFATAGVISLFAAIALFSLLYFGKKDRFYPAMPFITVGCFAGYLIMQAF